MPEGEGKGKGFLNYMKPLLYYSDSKMYPREENFPVPQLKVL